MTEKSVTTILAMDLGDGTTSVATLEFDSNEVEGALALPVVRDLNVTGEKLFPTAFAVRNDGAEVIGFDAIVAAGQDAHLTISMKHIPSSLTTEQKYALGRFAAILLQNACNASQPNLLPKEMSLFVGCPSGWSKAEMQAYERIFSKHIRRPVRAIPESEAALAFMRRDPNSRITPEQISEGVLLLDFGSSTLDWTYLPGNSERSINNGIPLGARIIETFLLERSCELNGFAPDEPLIQANWAWLVFQCRLVKEEFFKHSIFGSQEKYARVNLREPGGNKVRFEIELNAEILDWILKKPFRLGEDSSELGWKDHFEYHLSIVREEIARWTGREVSTILLTGGACRMPFLRDSLNSVFGDKVFCNASPEPDFCVARGLAIAASDHLQEEEQRGYKQYFSSQKCAIPIKSIDYVLSIDIGETTTAAIMRPELERPERVQLPMSVDIFPSIKVVDSVCAYDKEGRIYIGDEALLSGCSEIQRIRQYDLSDLSEPGAKVFADYLKAVYYKFRMNLSQLTDTNHALVLTHWDNLTEYNLYFLGNILRDMDIPPTVLIRRFCARGTLAFTDISFAISRADMEKGLGFIIVEGDSTEVAFLGLVQPERYENWWKCDIQKYSFHSIGFNHLSEALLEYTIASLTEEEKEQVIEIFKDDPRMRQRCLLESRRVLEEYFKKGQKYEVMGSVRLRRQPIFFVASNGVCQKTPLYLDIDVSPEIFKRVLNCPIEWPDHSQPAGWIERMRQILTEYEDIFSNCSIILSGRAGRLLDSVEILPSIFKSATRICDEKPATSISRGACRNVFHWFLDVIAKDSSSQLSGVTIL